MNNRITLSALALGIAGVLTYGQAHASGFQLRESSVKNLGRSNAGSAVFNGDANAVTGNPAAMSSFDKTTVRADVTAIDLSFQFKGDGRAAAAFGPNAPALTGSDGGDAGDLTPVPNISAVFPMHGALEGLTLGASIGAPFGLKTEYEDGWVGRYHALKSDVKVVDFTMSASVKLHDRFSVGAGLIYERAEATLTKAIDFGTALCSGSGNPANCFNPAFPFHPQSADGKFSVEGDDSGFGWLVGAQWQPTDALTVGFSHRSEVDHEIQGDIDFTLPASVQAALGPRAAGFADGTGGADLTLPSITTVSVRYDITDSVRVLADWQATDWSSLRTIDVKRSNGTSLGAEEFDWNDTEFYSLGAEWDMNDKFTLRAGFAVDETPTHDETRTPRLPDNDRKLYSVGVTWQLSDAFSVDAAYQRIEVDNPKMNVVSSSGSLLVGEAEGSANLFGIAAQYSF
ncbi:OmpP1/FadL family transporter [Lysobacter solisilvae (ex Woo and Kim 2022)]|uniref:Porin n=1 Tax=Agrilutibacter terrestris TaxID=2865112 RepID=A0A7H0G0L1_9GAMM|nr:porin [Lysobacter terrestris]QNP41827.1 porin [Lysobacter terrestris]